MNQLIETCLLKLNGWQRDAKNRARKDDRPYQWGFADGLEFASRLLIAEQIRSEKEQTNELAK